MFPHWPEVEITITYYCNINVGGSLTYKPWHQKTSMNNLVITASCDLTYHNKILPHMIDCFFFFCLFTLISYGDDWQQHLHCVWFILQIPMALFPHIWYNLPDFDPMHSFVFYCGLDFWHFFLCRGCIYFLLTVFTKLVYLYYVINTLLHRHFLLFVILAFTLCFHSFLPAFYLLWSLLSNPESNLFFLQWSSFW